MATYVVRRLLLMLPTLLGITFVVFMLVALSPGGVGGASQDGGPGGMQSGGEAQRRERLDQRYGLDAPVLVQYVRWLARISPVRFGPREQVGQGGEAIRPPREVVEPPLRGWWGGPASDEPFPPPPAIDPRLPVEERQRLYQQAESDQYRARVEHRARVMALEAALARYAEEAGLAGAVDRRGRPVAAAFRAAPPRRDLASWQSVVEAGAAASASADEARRTRAAAIAALEARPYPEAGIPLVPGLLWLTVPDLGVSVEGQRVTSLIADHLPLTLTLNGIAFLLIYLVAVPSGMLAAARRGTWLDVGLGALFVALWSIPAVWAGVLAIGYLANPQYLGWFPASGLHDRAADSFALLPRWSGSAGFERGWLLDLAWHICLPLACLVYGGFAVLSKQTRAAMLENLGADHVRTARAKGVPRRAVLLRHVFRNSLLPLITMFAGILPALLGGSVVIERIFSLPGMGTLMIQAIGNRDREVILAVTVMIAIVSMAAMLLADILYALVDPRVEYDAR